MLAAWSSSHRWRRAVPAESAVRIGVVLPALLGTYGDVGNAAVLRQRLRWRGVDAEVVPISRLAVTPTSCDLCLLGGAEDAMQRLAAEKLGGWSALRRAIERVPVLGVCAGMQILGQSSWVIRTEMPPLPLPEVELLRAERLGRRWADAGLRSRPRAADRLA